MIEKSGMAATTSYRDNVVGKPKKRPYIDYIAALEKRKKKQPSHKSKSVAALPCIHRFAATHMLFCPRTA